VTIQQEQNQIVQLEFQVESLKSEYAKMVYQAYKNRNTYNSIVFILSADDFYQAYKRYKIMQALSEGRQKQVEIIQETEQTLKDKINELKYSRHEALALKKEQEVVKTEIDQDRQSQQDKLGKLKKEEGKLRAQQKKLDGDRKKLNSKIQDIINRELAAERKKEEEKIKKLTAVNTPKTETPKGESPKAPLATKTETKSTAITLAPEVIALNSNFETNKGNLPWPVAQGTITSRFGKHNHPSLDDIVLNNNGVDFTTKQGENVLCVFGGKVTSVFSIPGAGYNIIVTHGTYKTVYSGLAQVSVKVGDKVNSKQSLGNVGMTDDEAVLHFELWSVNSTKGTAQNPESWIKRR
jgi:septal ring factor EnvC (AmiA/AmiB activator)